MKKPYSAFILLTVLLVGCTDSNITLVKNSTSLKENYKNVQLLDKNKNCDEVKWISTKDKNDRTIVQYICNIKITKDIIDYAKAINLKEVASIVDRLNRSYVDVRERAERNSIGRKKSFDDDQIKRENKIKELSEVHLTYEARINSTKNQNPEKIANEYVGLMAEYSFAERLKRAKNQILGEVSQLEYDMAREVKSADEEISNMKLYSKGDVEYNIKNSSNLENILSQIDSFKDQYYNTLKLYQDQDEKSINEILTLNLKPSQQIHFLVVDGTIVKLEHQFFINDERLQDNAESFRAISFGMNLPDNRTYEIDGWKSILGGFVKLKLEKFPLYCNLEKGCYSI